MRQYKDRWLYMQRDFYTVNELAALCRVHIITVRRWINQGKLKAIRLPGGLYRVPRGEVDRIREPVGVAAGRQRIIVTIADQEDDPKPQVGRALRVNLEDSTNSPSNGCRPELGA